MMYYLQEKELLDNEKIRFNI